MEFEVYFHPGMERPTWWILNLGNSHFVDGAIFHTEDDAMTECDRLNRTPNRRLTI